MLFTFCFGLLVLGATWCLRVSDGLIYVCLGFDIWFGFCGFACVEFGGLWSFRCLGGCARFISLLVLDIAGLGCVVCFKDALWWVWRSDGWLF